MYESSSSFGVDSDEEYEVVKTGSGSGHTRGYLKFSLSIRTPFSDKGGVYLRLDNCYTIYDRGNQPFVKPGDSGAAVYVLDRKDSSLHPLGLAIGRMRISGKTIACPIQNILEILNLSIIQPAQFMVMPCGVL